MIPFQPRLKDIAEIGQRHPKLQPYKYELSHEQMALTIIDLPKMQPQEELAQDIKDFQNATIIIARPYTATLKEHVQCIRRSSRIIAQLSLPDLARTNGSQSSSKALQSWNGLENVWDAFQKGQVEVIKTGWPHGVTIQVSFVEKCSKWMLSDGRRSRLIDDGQLFGNNEGNDKMGEIVQCWLKCIAGLKARETMKKKLSSLTISGKIIKKNKQILFYSVVDNATGIDLEPFEARKRMEEIGLKFVPIRSLGMFSQQEIMVNSLTKTIKSIRAQLCESITGVSGRAKVYFVKNDESFLGGGNILTSEDILLKQMKSVLLKKGDIKEKMEMFGRKIEQLRGLLPFPEKSYQSLFENLVKLVQILELNDEQVQSSWYRLPKLCLYLLSKRLSFSKYAKLYYQPDTLELISDIPLEEFGPIQSKITLIYYFIHPSAEWKQRVALKLKESYEAVDLPFSIISESISQAESIKKIITNNQQNLHHLFVHSINSLNQLKNLEISLNNASKDHFFKVIYITQSFKGETTFDDNTYPFSKATIVRSYLQALQLTKHSAKLDDKVKELFKVTTKVKEFKNYEVMNLKNRISISLFDQTINDELKKSIESVLKKYDYNSYLLLISKLQKMGPPQSQQELLNTQVTNIIKKSYTSIRTICIKAQ